MRFLPLVLRQLRHNLVRTTSTVLAMIVCIFLFCTLQTIVTAVDSELRCANASRLVVRNAISLFYSLPLTYRDKVRAVPGVKNVATAGFWLLAFGDSADFFEHPAYAIEPEAYLAIYPEYVLAPHEKSAFLAERRGCIIGPETAEEFRWKVGDAIRLEDRTANLPPFDFVVSGIYEVDAFRHPGVDTRILFFHHEYLEERSSHRVGAGFLVVEVDDPARAASVAAAIDRSFEDSERQTRTATESAFRAGMVSMAGNLTRILRVIGVAVVFTILVVTANTMSMAVRQRRREIAVLRTLGFGRGLVMALILGEALVLGVLGGSLGAAFGQVAIQALPRLPVVGWAVQHYPSLRLSASVGATGFALAIVLSLSAGLVPATIACRARVSDLLRTV
jgi:putative ABC transport system permease protein